MRDPLSVGVYKFPRTPNKLDEYLKYEDAQERAAAKKKPADEFEGLDQLGGVWERDIDNLTKDFIQYRRKKVEYEQEKDPAAKAALWQEGIKLGTKLETNIAKSKKNKQQYVAKAEQINKDNKLFLPEDSTERLDKWASLSIYDRPDNIGIEMPSTLDFIEEAKKRFYTTIRKPDVKSEKIRGGGVDKTSTIEEYDEDDVNATIESVYKNMPGNYIRAEKQRLMERYNYGTPLEQQKAAEALKDSSTLENYLKTEIRKSVEPGLIVKKKATAPSPKERAAGGGGAKPQYTVQTAQRQFGTGPTATMYTDVYATKTGGQNVERSFMVPTTLFIQENQKYNLGWDDQLDMIDPRSTPTMSIKGIFMFASRDQKTGEMTVTFQPQTFAGKYQDAKQLITLPLSPENMAAVNANLNGQNVVDLFDFEEKKNPRVPGEKVRKPASPPGAPKIKDATKPSGWDQYKR